jgi:hypothetical protein
MWPFLTQLYLLELKKTFPGFRGCPNVNPYTTKSKVPCQAREMLIYIIEPIPLYEIFAQLVSSSEEHGLTGIINGRPQEPSTRICKR